LRNPLASLRNAAEILQTEGSSAGERALAQRIIARQIEFAHVFLIAMSGYGSMEDRTEAKLAGFDEYMVKPIDLDRLRDLLRSRT
jgi:CheY-like chemotaxis protein